LFCTFDLDKILQLVFGMPMGIIMVVAKFSWPRAVKTYSPTTNCSHSIFENLVFETTQCVRAVVVAMLSVAMLDGLDHIVCSEYPCVGGSLPWLWLCWMDTL
jgi:hypothetical protein